MARVVPVVEGLRRRGSTIPISVDTRRAAVAAAAAAAGADMVNDVSGGEFDAEMRSTVARWDFFLIINLRFLIIISGERNVL